MKIVCGVSHFDEFTTELCMDALRRQTLPISEIKLVSGLKPTAASINACLDFAWDSGADILLHTAADVIAEPFALEELLRVFKADEHYAAVGRGVDVLNGKDASVGLWMLNMSDVQDKHRCRDEFLTDMRFIERLEADTGKARSYTPKGIQIGYHHPIWTARDMFGRMRYSTQKYSPHVQQRFRDFFNEQLRFNPDNVVLRLGLEVLEYCIDNPHSYTSKNKEILDAEFLIWAERYGVTGKEFYVHNERFKASARQLLNSEYDCLTVEERRAPPSMPRMAMVVGNAVQHDSRVIKAATSAKHYGYDVTLIGLSDEPSEKRFLVGDVPVHCIANPLLQNRKGPVRAALSCLLKVGSKEEYRAAAQRAKDWSQRRKDRIAELKLSRKQARRERRRIAAATYRLERKLLDARHRLRSAYWNLQRNYYHGAGLSTRPDAELPSTATDTFVQKTLKVTHALSAAILNLRPELIHAHDVNMVEAARWASDQLKIPWVYDAHEWVEGSDNILPEIHQEWIRLERGHIQSASAVVTVSPKIAEILASAYDLKAKPEVILNAPFLGDHKQRGPSVRSAAGVAEDTPLFVYSGKISVPRGLPTLLDAIASEPTFHLAVVCNPAASFYGRLKQRQSTDLAGRLHILPMVDSRDVTSYLRDASVGVHPMTHFPNAEVALPNKLFEYLHAGVPIVVSDVEMMSRFVRDYGLGAVFAAGDVSSLRDALHEALGMAPEIRRKLEQDANLKARFSWQHQAHALRGIYQSALATSRATMTAAL